MKTAFTSILFFALFTSSILAQKTVPATTHNTLDGKTVTLSEAVKKNKLTVVVFWAIWDNNGVNELNALNSKLTVPFYAVSIDPKTDESKVLPFVQGKNWKYNFLLDPNKELYRGLGGKFPPMILIVDNTGKVLYEKQGFVAGDEAIIIAKVNELSGK
jgi:AhpC/TSA family